MLVYLVTLRVLIRSLQGIAALIKNKGLYRKLTGMAMQLLKEGIDKERIVLLLQESLIPQTPITQSVETDMLPSLTSSRFVHAVINSVFKSDEGRHVTAPLMIHILPINVEQFVGLNHA